MRKYFGSKITNILLLVPTTSLVEQMYKDFKVMDGTLNIIGIVYMEVEKKNPKLVISLPIFYQITKFFDRFGAIIGDKLYLQGRFT